MLPLRTLVLGSDQHHLREYIPVDYVVEDGRDEYEDGGELPEVETGMWGTVETLV